MKRSLSLTGIPVSPGVAVGRAVLWVSREDSSPKRTLEPEEIEPEIERFRRAAESAAHEIESTARHVKESLGAEYAGIFQAHALFLKDRTFLGPIERRIAHEKVNAEWAVAETTADLSARFRSLPDEDFAHRGADIDDVARILKKHLGGEEYSRLRMEDLAGEAIVLVADELTPSDAVRIPRDRVVGFVTERGGRTSHAAILARSFGIPAVVGVPQLLAEVGEGDRVVVDGRDGLVWREPSESVVAFFRERRDQEARHEKSLKERSHDGITRTRDGAEVFVRANIELVNEIRDVLEYGADGVGLFRSEFLYLSKEGDEFPSEEEQSLAYREVLEGLAPRPVVIRTYDLGGKKGARHLVGSDEVNPVLGLRGVRLCFARPEMFSTQLRALLAAAGFGQPPPPRPDGLGRRGDPPRADSPEEGPRGRARAGHRRSRRHPARRDDRGSFGRDDRRSARARGGFPRPRDERPHPVHARRGPCERDGLGPVPADTSRRAAPRGARRRAARIAREAALRVRRDGGGPRARPAVSRPRDPRVLDGAAHGPRREGVPARGFHPGRRAGRARRALDVDRG